MDRKGGSMAVELSDYLSNDKLPCKAQTKEEKEAWFDNNAKAGLIVCIGYGAGGDHWYEIDEITRISPGRQRKFFTERRHGYPQRSCTPSFYYSGINICAPTGQTHAYIPTPLITELAILQLGWPQIGPPGKIDMGPLPDQSLVSLAREQYVNLFPGWTQARVMEIIDSYFTQRPSAP
jgi:hypothetical protein